MSETRSRGTTRRDALSLLGLSAVAAALPSAAFGEPAFPKRAVIRTLLKDYAPEELGGGATLFHEHLSLAPDFMERFIAATAATRAANAFPTRSAGSAAGRPEGAASEGDGSGRRAGPPPGPTRDLDAMVADVRNARRAGVACMVDAGHADMGRDLDFVRRVSVASGMPIVACAGLYTQPYYPAAISSMSEDEVVEALLEQVAANPIGAFGEIGSWDEMTADERKVFRAVGRAHAQTNLPIFTHTGIPGKAAIEQLDLLEDAGVEPERVTIGHLGSLVDPDVYVHRAICRRGAFVGFDRQGGNGDARQVPMVMALIEAGYADHLLFSSDASSGYDKTLSAFLPKLKAAGASDEVLHRIMVDNPRRFLAFVP
jgi:predicted metal-dependent phosphotriesterase family hydrolase